MNQRLVCPRGESNLRTLPTRINPVRRTLLSESVALDSPGSAVGLDTVCMQKQFRGGGGLSNTFEQIKVPKFVMVGRKTP